MGKNILVFPCGSEIGLEINNSLRFVKDLTLFGGSSIADHGRLVYENYVEGLPNVDDENFIEEMNRVIKEYDIDFIFPAHDSVVLKLAEHNQVLNAEVITSPVKTCQICRSKKKTYDYFSNENFIPKTYEVADEVDKYPVFLKPDVGQGSKGVSIATNKSELIHQLKKAEQLVISELLPGKEYTVDCFTDFKGDLRFAGMRERKRVKSGISVNSTTIVLNEQVKEIAKRINDRLEFRGVWFFQVKEDDRGMFKLLEIAPRIAGTMTVHRNKGINFGLLSILDRLNIEVDIINNKFEVEVDRALINRFNLNINYDRVYIDFDDTVTNRGNINTMVMMFLYQCLNKNKEIILITKHIKNITETLKTLKIDKDLFNEIIHITNQDEKFKYFSQPSIASIFIDDSFSERKMILDKIGLPVFDIDSIESLIDWRN